MSHRPLLLLFVLGFVTPAFGSVMFFVGEEPGFHEFREAQGCNVHVGTELFDCCSTTPAGGIDALACPLCMGVPNVDPFTGTGYPNGLCQPMCMWSTYEEPSADLVSLGTGFVGNHSVVVGANWFAANTNADFSGICTCGPGCINFGGYCAVGFDCIDGLGGAGATINAYDVNNRLLGSTQVSLPGPTSPLFIGAVVTRDSPWIGRIEIACASGELTDRWQLYVPEPATLSLLALGGLVLLRRR